MIFPLMILLIMTDLILTITPLSKSFNCVELFLFKET